MPPKAKIPAPIDRPLSRAYLREFTGWSTAEPPGISDPTSLRIMENVLINRDGSARIRPGLRYLSYDVAPYTSDGAPSINPVSGLVLRGYVQIGGPAGTQVPLPVGSVVGDLVVVSMHDGNDGGRNDKVALGSVTDTRLTGHVSHPSGDDYWGTLTDLTDLDIAYTGNGIVYVSVFGDTEGGTSLVVRDDWVSTSKSIDFGNATDNINIPSLDVNGVVIITTEDIGTANVAPDMPGYTSIDEALEIRMEYWSGASPSPAYVWGETSSYQRYDRTITVLPVYLEGPPGVASDQPGVAADRPLVGNLEPFYLNDGTKAYLMAVREEDETVGFRAMVLSEFSSTMYTLTHALIDFDIEQPAEVLNFTSETTYVKYLQIDNKIFALSDNGENMRMFTVGEHKTAKTLFAIERPEWETADKLDVIHPEAAWIDSGEPDTRRRNRLPNPSFETNTEFWTHGNRTKLRRPADPPVTPESGDRVLRLESTPVRENLVTSPLHDVATTDIDGWSISTGELGGTPTIAADGTWLEITTPAGIGYHYAKSRILPGVDGGEKYQLAVDFDEGAHIGAVARVRFFGVNGAQVGNDIERDIEDGPRWISSGFTAPKGATSARVWLGGLNGQNDVTTVRFKNVVLCKHDENTDIFSGDSGAYYFWTGADNASSSVYHPPADVSISAGKVTVRPSKELCGSLYVEPGSTIRDATLDMRIFNKHGELIDTETSGPVTEVAATMTRLDAQYAVIPANATQADLKLTIPDVEFGEYHYVDAAMIECANLTMPDTYFDGSSPDVPMEHHEWLGKKHASASRRETFLVAQIPPTEETPTADTLVSSGGAADNVYSFAFFYTFNNEVGESAASRVTVRRAQRAWSDWIWETPDALGAPSGTATNKPDRCADQLVAIMPEDVWDEAIAQGAILWSLYMLTWSDQEPAPAIATKVGEREIREDSTYDTHGWQRVTPQMIEATDLSVVPTKDNRYNYSDPSRGSNGLVAADRMIVVNDPTAAAVIRWSSNRVGEYTNFTASKGGGYKTLTSGNLFVPAAVKLWQNPQSADTICILCLGTDGHSTSYYMAPAQVASQADAVNVMGFEETTATPGTTSPYGVEIFNNSMYHPLDDQLMKSTASNYNINHKSQTDMIRDMWERLVNKYWIISAVHDSRLYYIVTNPDGDLVEEGCNGNEVWVFDAAAKTGTWSRFKIQAHSLRKIEFGGQIYMAIVRPDGIYYLDPEYGLDDYVINAEKQVGARAIPWTLETNTQGANRAHDAWCHLQQAIVSLGYFQGRLRYGVRGVDIHGRDIDFSKIVKDADVPDDLAYDIEDHLKIGRDIKEWFFYAESLTDDEGVVEPSFGQINLVQYRYTPSSVNTGYELGSVETFQYGRDVAGAASTTTANGIPLPLQDSRRP